MPKRFRRPEFGFHLDGVLRAHAAKLTGILNGVDYGEWNPETDPLIAANYPASDLRGKKVASTTCCRFGRRRRTANVR